ncbi:MAG: phenylalanine--tRNA ligase subunit beta, partial [Acidobacteria bacterium]|nr:phenylalanine--tRNA ligase subunit beta [Acidobacteriota bacterium]
MRFPLSWIREFTPIPQEIDLLSNGFTFSGTEVEEILEIEGEKVFDFNFTVNRPDLMSIYGLSRESSAIFDLPHPKYAPKPSKSPLRIENEISIEVLDSDLCPRYRALVIKGAKVGKSTPLIQKRLLQCGLRPINAVVDATNYVLLEYGHPLHAFDIKFINDKKVIVRRAKDGEIIKLLDGSEKKLTKDMLVIADSKRALAVAGVMGGEESGVSFLTKDILLEGAVFNPASIRRTSKTLNIHTDASHRFERGCDYNGVIKSLDRVAELILEMCGGQLCENEIDIRKENTKIDKINFRLNQLKRILGIEIPKEKVIEILNKLDFKTQDKGDGILSVEIPTFRVDVEREIDIVEEIIRIYGLDKL